MSKLVQASAGCGMIFAGHCISLLLGVAVNISIVYCFPPVMADIVSEILYPKTQQLFQVHLIS